MYKTMGEQGAALQKYNQELVKCIETIKFKRNELLCEIEREENIKNNLESEMAVLKSQLETMSANLQKKHDLKTSYETAIKESEVAYMKILESSEILLTKVKRESEILGDSLL